MLEDNFHLTGTGQGTGLHREFRRKCALLFGWCSVVGIRLP